LGKLLTLHFVFKAAFKGDFEYNPLKFPAETPNDGDRLLFLSIHCFQMTDFNSFNQLVQKIRR
jgi:hypothetical protein